MGFYNATAPTAPNSGAIMQDQCDSTGSVYCNNEGRKGSFRATATGIAVSANGAMFSLQGSATKTIRVSRVYFNGVLTTGAQVQVTVSRTTAAVTGASGTAAITPAKLDSGNSAATGAANSYTASTLGTGAVTLAQARAFIAPASALSTGVEILFGGRNTQSAVIRGAAEFLQISVSTGAYTGAAFDIDVEFTEE